jgi:hypothetical protein
LVEGENHGQRRQSKLAKKREEKCWSGRAAGGLTSVLKIMNFRENLYFCPTVDPL